jgi:DNA transposition AAA+ family ATPase
MMYENNGISREPSEIHTQRTALHDYIKTAKKSQAQIAKETGLSQTVISQFLNGTYTGDNAKAAKTIDQYLDMEKQRSSIGGAARFYAELPNTLNVISTANYAHKYCDITLISGESGAGKTTALKRYADNNAGVIFVTANASATRVTSVLSAIASELGVNTAYNGDALMKAIVERLAGTKRLIIVDEADHLTLAALQAVRNLNDCAGVGIVLAGNDKIHRQMLTSSKGYEFDQIRKRIMVRKQITNDYTPDDIKAIFPVNDDCAEFLLKIAKRECLRTAQKFYGVARDFAIANGKPLTLKTLKEVAQDIMGGFCA